MFCCYEDYFSKEFCAKNLFHSISFMLNKIILEMVSIATKVLCLFTPRKNKENMIKILRGNNVNTRYLIFTIFSTEAIIRIIPGEPKFLRLFAWFLLWVRQFGTSYEIFTRN